MLRYEFGGGENPQLKELLRSGTTDGFISTLQFYIYQIKPAAEGHLIKILSHPLKERRWREKELVTTFQKESFKCLK